MAQHAPTHPQTPTQERVPPLQACHHHVNHTLSGLDRDAPNPFQPGSVHVP
jgi:hypothetical protein